MFQQGMTIEKIAKERDLSTGTIAGHLEQYVHSGEIKVEHLVSLDKIKKIQNYLKTNGFTGLSAIKAALGDDVSYADIKFVVATSSSNQ